MEFQIYVAIFLITMIISAVVFNALLGNRRHRRRRRF